jgi:hypothetical protein
MTMLKRLSVVAAVVLMLAAVAAAAERDTRLSDRQRLVQVQFRALLTDMAKLAQILEGTEPDNAKRLRGAIKSAQDGLVAGDMQRLIAALRTAKFGDAQSDAKKVIDGLNEMLRVLTEREPGIGDPSTPLGTGGKGDKAETLELLETMLLKMLRAQKAITADTVKLDKVATQRTKPVRADELAFRALGSRESGVASDAAKVSALLEENGSSVVLLSIMEDTREMMLNVAKLLRGLNGGRHTQALEKDIEQALADMLAAVRLELKVVDVPPPGPGAAPADDAPLVQPSAELKLLKALQTRINARTLNLQGERGTMAPKRVAEQAARLAGRQARVRRLAQELSAKLKADETAPGNGTGIS